MSRKLECPRQGRMIGGVCAGLANYFGTSPGVVRVLAVLSCLLPGPQFVAYIVLWIVMPKSSDAGWGRPADARPLTPQA